MDRMGWIDLHHVRHLVTHHDEFCSNDRLSYLKGLRLTYYPLLLIVSTISKNLQKQRQHRAFTRSLLSGTACLDAMSPME